MVPVEGTGPLLRGVASESVSAPEYTNHNIIISGFSLESR